MNRGAKTGNGFGSPRFLALVLCVGVTLTSAHAVAFDLITNKEARTQTEPYEGAIRFVAIGRGPSIEISGHRWKDGYLYPPFDLEIHFKAFGGAKIDPRSIQILYMSYPPRDLTERLKPFLKDDVVTVKGFSVPSGAHKIQVYVRDSKGFQGRAIFDFKVH
jgi:hypothetical protein